MLRHRQSLKSKPALSHRKSTSSARSVVLEHLDPIVAQREAQTAAHQAFTRAQDRSTADMAVFPPPPSPSPLRTIQPTNGSTRNDSSLSTEHPSMPRRQSVRFVGPCTVAKGGRQRPQTPASTVHGAMDPASMVESSTRPATSASARSSKAVSDYLHSLNAADNIYTPEDDVASIPSSYRRLRRSRSLHPSLGVRDSGENYLLPPPGPRREVRTSMSMRTLKPGQGKENIQPQKFPTLKAPKSMSFLKGRRGRLSSITSYDVINDTQANADPIQPPAQPSLRTKTSSFFGSKTRRTEPAESGLRKTLRKSSSQAELVPPSVDTGLPLPKGAGGSLRIKARKASKTLRNKLKNLFSSAKEDDDAEFPDQHVKSQKKHTDQDFVALDTGPDEHNQQGGVTEQASLHYNHGNMSEVFSAPQGSRTCSRKASLPVFGGQAWGQGPSDDNPLDDKSRVTSWTNSGPSTLTSEQQAAWTEWEKQRLSIIKETGAHCPSPSLRRQAIGKHILQSQESLIGQPILPGPTVDSQRVYAALMERLAETTQLAQVVEQQRKSLAEATPAPPQAASNAGFEDYEDNDAKPAPLMVRRTSSKISTTAGVGDANKQGNGNMLSPPVALAPWNDNHGVADGRDITSAERTNAFFGSPEAHLFRTVSPYRRALRKSMEEADNDLHGRNSGDRIISECGTEIRRPEEACYDDAYSESVYSSDEPPAGTASNAMHSLTQMVQGPPSSAGNMSMSVDPPVTYRPTGHRAVSSVSSIDWKTWLSANVARFEPSPSPPRPSDVQYPPPDMPSSSGQGHVREAAQIVSDEYLGHPHQSPAALPSSASKRLDSGADIIPSLQKSVGVLAEIDSRAACRESPDELLPSPELPPPIPARSPLRMHQYPVLAESKPADKLSSQSKRAEEGHSPAHKPSVNRLRELNQAANPSWTPIPKSTKLKKKRSGFLYTPSVVKSEAASPGLTAAVEKQFGPAAKTPAPSDENKENEVSGGPGGIQKSGNTLASGDSVNEEERSTKGRRMVNVFLNSRRKRMASSNDDSPAFL